MDALKHEYTYNANGNMTTEIEYTLSNDEWTPSSKYEYEFDATGNRTSEFSYSMSSGTWVQDGSTTTVYDLSVTIDQIVYPQDYENYYQILEAKNKIISHGSMTFYHSELTPTGLRYASMADPQVKMNMNLSTASKGRTIRIDVSCNARHEVKVYRINGSVLFSVKGTGSQRYHIPIKQFASGVYLVSMKVERKVFHKKISVWK